MLPNIQSLRTGIEERLARQTASLVKQENIQPKNNESKGIQTQSSFEFDSVAGVPKNYQTMFFAAGLSPSHQSQNNDQLTTEAWGGFGAGQSVPGAEDPNAPLGHSDFTGYGEFDFNLEDTDWKTSPFNPFSMWRHFRDAKDVEQDLIKDIETGDRDSFERHMHQGQDFYTHYNKGYRWYPTAFHFGFGHMWDKNADNDPEAWKEAEDWTTNWIDKWHEKWGTDTGSTDVSGAAANNLNDASGSVTAENGIHVNQNEGDPDGINADCGPTSVLMAIRLAGGSVEGDTTADKIGNVRQSMYPNNAELDGIDQFGNRDDAEHSAWTSMNAMRTGLDSAGVSHRNVAPRLQSIAKELTQGNSVILAGGQGHFIVASEYDPATQTFTVHDPAKSEATQMSVNALKDFMYDNTYGIVVEPLNDSQSMAV